MTSASIRVRVVWVVLSLGALTPVEAFTPAALHPALRVKPIQVNAAACGGGPPAISRKAVAIMSEYACLGQQQTGTTAIALGRALARSTLVIAVIILSMLLSAGRALAATATRVSTGSGSGIIKYVALGGLVIAGSFFSNAPSPTIVETVLEDGTKPQTEAPESLDGLVDPVPHEDATGETGLDDSMLLSSLQNRMQALVDGDGAVEQNPADSFVDSTDSWGEGSTGVLEPSKPEGEERPLAGVGGGLMDNAPAAEFPTGFPLIDGEVVERETGPATVSEDQLAMLKRMMGEA